ncbi:uncharacterized protein LOC128985585 isoform X4 [Macrosteles quadrilineatus]|uniref:uncharacterized protein LOC128985585 isoform X4 n=1 Tax=Macrosteles quadrilineatus TaxID=74068 RepID=UPI0023E17387|nr:uncharacterized protein LOC128985585 isoform X4 [Macrosteles quadrilineatus]
MAEVAVVTMILAALIPLYQAVTMVQEVGLGDMAVLNCPSNDESHRFQFWQLQTQNLMIGPTNKFNRDKYKYEVLTGTLYIRGVSSNEQGVYTCICKHISNNSFYAENVELVVKRDWEEVYETDHFLLLTKNLLTRLALSMVDKCLTWTATGWIQNFHDQPHSQMSVWGTQPSNPNLTFQRQKGVKHSYNFQN